MPVSWTRRNSRQSSVRPKPGAPKELALKLRVYPAYLSFLDTKGEGDDRNQEYLSTLSVQEGLRGLLQGVAPLRHRAGEPVDPLPVLGVHRRRGCTRTRGSTCTCSSARASCSSSPASLLCQFVVLPGAVKALLMFNEWLGFDPDIRLNEWLGLAMILPLVFGISFQTPLVMVFLNRIGMFSAEDYLSKVAARLHDSGLLRGHHHADARRGDDELPLRADVRAVHARASSSATSSRVRGGG